MPVTVKVNGVANSLVHKGSNGVSVATIPDVCKTPSPGGPVPIPYPNISQSITLAKGTTTVKADGGMMIANKGSEFSLSNGDNPGVAGGVKSSTFMKESTWILYSFDVKMDGKGACRLTDKKFQNHENTVDLGGALQAVVAVELGLSKIEREVADCLCNSFCEHLNRRFKRTNSGGWTKRETKQAAALSQAGKRMRLSKMLEHELAGKTPQPVPSCMKKHDVRITEKFELKGMRTTYPDATLFQGGSPTRCFDFKFPSDSFRKPGRGVASQMTQQTKIAGGKEPVEISHKTCDCD